MLSILPKTIKPIRRQFSVPHRMLNIPMPHLVLNRPGIVAVVGQLITAGMAQHVGMDGEADIGVPAGPAIIFRTLESVSGPLASAQRRPNQPAIRSSRCRCQGGYGKQIAARAGTHLYQECRSDPAAAVLRR